MQDLPTRKNFRLPGYDYSGAGYYFVTICTKDRRPVLGLVRGHQVTPSNAGLVVVGIWESVPVRFSGVSLDTFVLMPNHIHCIVVIDDNRPGSMNRASTLGDVVRKMKAASTRSIRREFDPVFSWQRNYYEHVIRSEGSLNRIRRYIQLNPLLWALDRYRPRRHALTREAAGRIAARNGLDRDDVDLCRKHLIL